MHSRPRNHLAWLGPSCRLHTSESGPGVSSSRLVRGFCGACMAWTSLWLWSDAAPLATWLVVSDWSP
eukprot:15422657-Alexandrium_andersonii.AAC.1